MKAEYFPYGIQFHREQWERLDLDEVRRSLGSAPPVLFFRHLAARLNRDNRPVQARELNLFALLNRVFRHVVAHYATDQVPDALALAAARADLDLDVGPLRATLLAMVGDFPPTQVIDGLEAPVAFLTANPERPRITLLEVLLVKVAAENPAVDPFRAILDDSSLAENSPYLQAVARIEDALRDLPPVEPVGLKLPDLLRAPARASPHSLLGQLEYVRQNWAAMLPEGLEHELLRGVDLYREEEREWWGTAGPPQVLEFGEGARRAMGALGNYPEPEAYSPDRDWMSNVVLMAKMTHVWLDQLSRRYGRPIRTLDQIPDEELDTLARWGFTGLWLIGVFERSPASQKIKQISGNPEAMASAYSLYDYQIASDLGGEAALFDLKERAMRRGIRLAADMVPNHCGIWSRWIHEHPDWFIQVDQPPYPCYTFTGPDLSGSPDVSIRIEDGYWSRRDAAVVFQLVEHRTGRVRYIYHGNDGTSTPWNDTAQLDHTKPEVREALIRTILDVARKFPIIRFDAAMTLAKLHYQRLWFPPPGQGGGVPSRSEHGMTREEFDRVMQKEFWREVVDRVAVEAPDTLLLAEAFWLMEGYFVRTLGMHRVYNSAFMNMLKMEDNANWRKTVKNVLEFDPEILKRFVNFMNNPDERTAVEQFGKEGKYVGVAVMMVTMPGLPMFGHGQIEGFHEKYGMEYRRAYWDEPVDQALVAAHERHIFPLMRKRRLFSGSENFAFYDFVVDGYVNEDVFAYSNRADGERALILYNNRYNRTAGFVRDSVAYAVKDGSGNKRLERTTLSKALALKADKGCYYTFTDWATGLTFVRSGQELHERGIFAELGEFQYQALMDWQEVWDTPDAPWAYLCERLGGRGVTDMGRELFEARKALLQRSLRDLLTLAPTKAADLGEAYGHLAAAVARTTGTGHVEEAVAGFGRDVGTPAVLGQRLLVAFVALRRLGHLPGLSGRELIGWLDNLGLIETAQQVLGERSSAMLRALLCHSDFFKHLGTRDQALALRDLFADALVKEATGLHTHDGVEWFHKESFEELVSSLAVVATLDGGKPKTRARDRLLKAAQDASFRTDRLYAILGRSGRRRTRGKVS